jgi:hypothetical protein
MTLKAAIGCGAENAISQVFVKPPVFLRALLRDQSPADETLPARPSSLKKKSAGFIDPALFCNNF